jgi:hypothetical protein
MITLTASTGCESSFRTDTSNSNLVIVYEQFRAVILNGLRSGLYNTVFDSYFRKSVKMIEKIIQHSQKNPTESFILGVFELHLHVNKASHKSQHVTSLVMKIKELMGNLDK